MFCHVFIIMMQIWIFVYLWNKRCLNLWFSETLWFPIMVCHLESRSVCVLFVIVLWTNVPHYKICYYISNFCSFRCVCSLKEENTKSQILRAFMICRCVCELLTHWGYLLFCIIFIIKPLRCSGDYQPPSYCQHGWYSLIYTIYMHPIVFIVSL